MKQAVGGFVKLKRKEHWILLFPGESGKETICDWQTWKILQNIFLNSRLLF